MSPAGWRKPVVPFLISIDEPSLGESISKEVAGCVCVLGGGGVVQPCRSSPTFMSWLPGSSCSPVENEHSGAQGEMELIQNSSSVIS